MMERTLAVEVLIAFNGMHVGDTGRAYDTP